MKKEKWSGEDIRTICKFLKKYKKPDRTMFLVEVAYVIKHWMKSGNSFDEARIKAHIYDIDIPTDLTDQELDFIKLEINAIP